VVVSGEAGAPYLPGLLALREGALLEAAVRALPRPPEVLLVDATGRDHPRRAGLATQ
jgi:deoxyribonuclease V